MAAPDPGAAVTTGFQDTAIDQLAVLIEEERADASEQAHQQLEQLSDQFFRFREAANAIHAENQAINAKARKDLETMEHTLRQAGIHYSESQGQGHLSFGQEWGDIVQGLKSHSADVPPPRLTPQEVLGMLQWQRRENVYQRDQDSAQIDWLKQELAGQNGCRTQDADAKGQIRISKRPRLSVDTYSPSFAHPCFPSDTSSPSNLGRVIVPAASSPNVCHGEPYTAPPALENWALALADVEITHSLKPQPRSVIPPLSVFAGAHSCSYYLWFATRSYLFRQLTSGAPVHTSWTTQEWELKLHNKRSGHVDTKRAYGDGETICDCGAPRIKPVVLLQLRPLRAGGTPVQGVDFESESLQALLCVDVELARAKLQFEQTDDIVLDVLLWSPQQLLNRIQARRSIFRNSWDTSFGAAPLEGDIHQRRAWIFQFANLLQDWPDFQVSTGTPVALTDPESWQDIDGSALLSYERRLLAFYLRTVSKTLGIFPSLPRRRPHPDVLPPLYRNFVVPQP
ncbi:hypothetical protein FB45DRAFT_519693 [Roridomyces roridus]|uniref:Uncharacterized protein n=1 Tax=Roridomyces roridus TaxID=1738132 RepID=A0AAD7BX89_9AGAR|nr:hypothetical protein FB45DRAFT_519693 [Roridomyces roridus]